MAVREAAACRAPVKILCISALFVNTPVFIITPTWIQIKVEEQEKKKPSRTELKVMSSERS